ncbi:MAG: 3-deoxy-D-manno-octulosonic acid transferase, partial [Planctomycetota bacterium]
DAAVDVHNEAELETFLRRCLEQPDYAAALGGRAQALVLEQQGATERTWRLLEPLLPRPA